MTKHASEIEGLVEKLSLYDLWNYFFTGAVFYILLDRYTSFGTGTTYTVWWNILLCGFVGMIFNRIGGLIDMLFNLRGIDTSENRISKTTYKQYISASSKDKMIEIFWNRASFFRSGAVMLFAFAVVRGIDIYPKCFCQDKPFIISLLCTLLLIVSYSNAEKTIRQRIIIAENVEKKPLIKGLFLCVLCICLKCTLNASNTLKKYKT